MPMQCNAEYKLIEGTHLDHGYYSSQKLIMLDERFDPVRRCVHGRYGYVCGKKY